jgi:hypothetical protein
MTLRTIAVQSSQDLAFDQGYVLIGACYMGNYENRLPRREYPGQPRLRALTLFPMTLCPNVNEDISSSYGSASIVKQVSVPLSTGKGEVSTKSPRLGPTKLAMQGYRMLWTCVSWIPFCLHPLPQSIFTD